MRNKTALGQTALQRHLAAFKADFMETTGTCVLALVTATGRLAEAAADTATDALFRVFRAAGGFDGVKKHLSLTFHEVIDALDHAADCRSINNFDRMIDAAQTETAHGGAVGTDCADDAFDLGNLDGFPGGFGFGHD